MNIALLPTAICDEITVGDRAIVRTAPRLGDEFEGQVVGKDRVFDVGSGTFGPREARASPGLAIPAGPRRTVGSA